MSLGARLGDTSARRRRHRRAALLAVAVLAVAAVLVFAIGDDDESTADFTVAANETCTTFSERVASEYELSFPEGPVNEAAVAEYLSHAFADTMDELVATLRGIPGASGEAVDAIDALAARIVEVRAEPGPYAAREALLAEDLAPRFDGVGLRACGSDFLLDAS